EEIILKGNLPTAVKSAIIQALGSHQALSSLLLKSDDQAINNIIKVLCKVLQSGHDIDLTKLQ
ncbi:hypothetical protein ACTD34_004673, partial [Yersinia enterocolitica]